jgi:DNA-binding IclR family transcriptional regulator
VLSFPFQLRFLFASRPELMGRVLGIVYRAISTQLIQKQDSLETQYTITDPDLLEAQMEQIAAQKYSINNQEDGIGLIAIAVPVRNAQGEVLAGLAVHAPEARFPIASAIERLPELHLAAEKIGQSMFDRG